jgi:TonB family protein
VPRITPSADEAAGKVDVQAAPSPAKPKTPTAKPSTNTQSAPPTKAVSRDEPPAVSATPSAARAAAAEIAPRKSERISLPPDDANFGRDRRKIIMGLVLTLLLGGIGTAVYFARESARETKSLTAGSGSTSATAATTSAPVDAGPPASVEVAIRDAQPRKLGCLDAARRRKPKIVGKVTIEFQLADEGVVKDAKVTESTVGEEGLEKCLLDVVRSIVTKPPEKDAPRKFTYSAEAS